MRSEDRRDDEALYNKMTIEELMVNFTEPGATDPIKVVIWDTSSIRLTRLHIT